MPILDCPSCGRHLDAHAGAPSSAPWVCFPCHRSFWTAELSDKARTLYRPLFHDWGLGLESAVIREAVDREREDAIARGTSALPEHLPHLSDDHLRALQRLPLSAGFAAHVAGALTRTEPASKED